MATSSKWSTTVVKSNLRVLCPGPDGDDGGRGGRPARPVGHVQDLGHFPLGVGEAHAQPDHPQAGRHRPEHVPAINKFYHFADYVLHMPNQEI